MSMALEDQRSEFLLYSLELCEDSAREDGIVISGVVEVEAEVCLTDTRSTLSSSSSDVI